MILPKYLNAFFALSLGTNLLMFIFIVRCDLRVVNLSDVERIQYNYGGSREVLRFRGAVGRDVVAEINTENFQLLVERGLVVPSSEWLKSLDFDIRKGANSIVLEEKLNGCGIDTLRYGNGLVGGQWAPSAVYIKKGDVQAARALVKEIMSVNH